MVCFSLERNVKEPCMLRIIWQARGIKDCVHTMTQLSALLKKTNTATHKVFHPPITLYTIVKLNTIPSYSNSISTPPLFFSISHRLLCHIMNGISSDYVNEDCVTGHLCQSQSLVTVSWPQHITSHESQWRDVAYLCCILAKAQDSPPWTRTPTGMCPAGPHVISLYLSALI